PVDDTPECARDEENEEQEENQPRHQLLGFWALPVPGCAERMLSSARFAAWPSGLSGASWMSCCHACAAPSRSCLPKAFTIPTVRSVFVCLGSICSECANCTSALSGWFV